MYIRKDVKFHRSYPCQLNSVAMNGVASPFVENWEKKLPRFQMKMHVICQIRYSLPWCSSFRAEVNFVPEKTGRLDILVYNDSYVGLSLLPVGVHIFDKKICKRYVFINIHTWNLLFFVLWLKVRLTCSDLISPGQFPEIVLN